MSRIKWRLRVLVGALQAIFDPDCPFPLRCALLSFAILGAGVLFMIGAAAKKWFF
jgi:hypothetical protein